MGAASGLMVEQSSIRSTRLGRMAAFAGTGTRVGINYLKHYGQRSIGRAADENDLHERNAEAVYKTFSELKGGPLKVAQMLSMDDNLLPAAYAGQFSKAQYSAPPLSYPLVVRTFRREMGLGPLEVFDTFSETALHGASIGQVHKASKDGSDYAVKVQYPGVAESLRSDLRIIKPVALQLIGVRERDVEGYFREVEARLLEETDYTLELRRSMELSEASAHLKGVSFPNYFPKYSCRRILTMEWVDGLPLDRFAKGGVSQEDRDRVGQALWDFYDFQIHSLRLFHADPHPGNFLVRDGGLVVLDFGCTKKIDSGFYERHFRFLDGRLLDDPAGLDAALTDLEIVLPGDTEEFRSRVRELCAASLEVLARPFRDGWFDFSDPDFMRSIYELGEQNRRDPSLRRLRGQRGSPDSIYVNRAYFGLYSLLSLIGARVKTSLPAWLRS
jgi:predicted unusual protein kinase regulating ubiquinone biosynthesis (AarF/ABC1/UbiB family)